MHLAYLVKHWKIIEEELKMYAINYKNYKGGINNLIIAIDDETGITATSTKSKEQAIKNLKRQLLKYERLNNIHK